MLTGMAEETSKGVCMGVQYELAGNRGSPTEEEDVLELALTRATLLAV
jgi:hypothetical protein